MHFLGDMHGDFYTVERFCRRNETKTKINVIQVGDFGAGFGHNIDFIEMMDHLNSILAEFNVTLYVMRGNHDDPAYFDGKYTWWSNLKFMPDYSVLELEGKRILLVGGAISIDRKVRTEGRSYWKDEVYVLDEEKLKMIKDIDIVVTHNSPHFCNPRGFNALVRSFAADDPDLLDELTHERNLLTVTHDILKNNGNPIQQWFYGHFHHTFNETHGDIHFHLLTINQYHELVWKETEE